MKLSLLITVTLAFALSASCKRADEPEAKPAKQAASPAAKSSKGAIDKPTLPPKVREGDVEAAAKYELGPQVAEMTNQLADAVEANTADCDKMADAVSDLLAERGDLLGQMQTTRGSAEHKAWTRVNADDIEATTARLEKMAPCLDKSDKLLDAVATML